MELNKKKAKIRKLMGQLGTVSGELHELKQSLSKKTVAPTPTTIGGVKSGNYSDDETDSEMVYSPLPMATAAERVGKESLLGDPSERTISWSPCRDISWKSLIARKVKT